MDTGTERRIVFCTVIAVVLGCALPAGAADSRTLIDSNGLLAGLPGRALSSEEMESIRGLYLPPGSTVAIQIGNGDNTSTTYYQRNPSTPGSATVTTTGSTTVTGYASTGTSSSSFTRSFSSTRTFGR